MREVARDLASLAQVWVIQDGKLRVRQREQLRRAFSAAAELLEWSLIHDDPVETALGDVTKLTKAGARSLGRELDAELADKKAEMSELKKVARSLEKLAQNGDFEEPVEVSYVHTARDAGGLSTKTETVSVTEAEEALDAAKAIEKKLDSWEKLRDQMVVDLKEKRRQLDEAQDAVAPFVESSKTLAREVFATLY